MTLPFISLILAFDFDAPAESSPSSKVVALVEYEPSAEELLLWEGEPSKSACEIDLASPPALSKECVFELLWLTAPMLGLEPLFDLRLPDDCRPGPFIEDAVPGRLPGRGGCGNAAMLIVLRRDLSGLLGTLAPDADLAELILVVELESGDLSAGFGLEGVRNLCGEAARDESDEAGMLFRDFGAGNWGSAPMGGPAAGLDGCGNVDILQSSFRE